MAQLWAGVPSPDVYWAMGYWETHMLFGEVFEVAKAKIDLQTEVAKAQITAIGHFASTVAQIANRRF
jgi:hypothetical protein